ncbi:MAG: hypothetical protein M3O61_14885 [Gemmatimonadota bacterium]|nr:hypothetical protein [Gemmatimonadota bacterium]
MKASRLAVTVLVGISALAWFLLLLSTGLEVPIGFFSPLGKVVTGIILLLAAFDKWLWRLLPSNLIKRPKVYGTWRVALKFNWIDPTTGAVVDSRNAFLVIHQTFSAVDARLLTAESKSHQLSAQLVPSTDNDEYLLVAVYRNEPKLLIRELSPIHFGALVLRIPAAPSRTLTGEYWTDRLTCGELSGRDRDGKRFSTFTDAEAHWVKKATPRA